jgi:membrane-bound lytic murein transglycosylase A
MRAPGAPSHRGRREAAGPVRSLRAALGAAVVFVACAATPSSDVRAWAPSSSAEAGTVASTAGVRGSLRDAIASARTALAKRPPTAETRDAQAALAGLQAALGSRSSGADALDERRMAHALSASGTRPVMVTGYHEPSLRARRSADAKFPHPLLGLPTGGTLPSRAEIGRGALAGRGLELFWVDDPVELYFLQVQGSGRLVLDDGTRVRIGYAGTNGRPYTSIGALLVKSGVFASPEQATAPAIKAWMRAHPGEAAELAEKNERFTFFRVLPGTRDEGPPGSLGAPLVPWRSVAVDPAVTPLGSVGWLAIRLPDGREFSQFVLAMDTGAAIRGPGRIDLFLGPGDEAERVAGELRVRGEVTWFGPPRS